MIGLPEHVEQVKLRDTWNTPAWLTELLPTVELDPCSNPRSTVKAHIHRMLERNEDGLAGDWYGLVFCNPPYSDVMPWAQKLAEQFRRIRGAAFLVNADSSTQWFKLLRRYLTLRFDFDKRIQFDPPPGVQVSSNSKPQTLLCTETFWVECDERLQAYGTLWRRV